MRVIRVFAIGVVVAGGVGIGCGEDGTNPTTTESAELQASKATKIEGFVKETDLVSDLAGARKTDTALANGWGLVFKDGFAWIATNHSSDDRQYDEDGNGGQVINLPLPGDPQTAPTSSPTGQVVNPFPNAFHGDHLIVVSEDGVVFGVNPLEGIATKQPESIAEVPNTDGAIYKGVALSTFHGKPRLFATDFHNRKIDVFDENFTTPSMSGDFTDPQIQDLMEVGSTGEPAHYAPFNIQAFGDHLLLVTYALQLLPEAGDDDKGPGRGFVDIFDTDGRLIQRLISRGGALNSPWGLALSPRTRPDRSTDLLVGNFGDGRINAYELSEDGRRLRARFEGALGDVKTGKPLAIDGLWAIVFGPGRGGFDRDDIYFTAGPNDEHDGVFGELDFVGPRR